MRELQVRYDEQSGKIVLRTRSFEGIEVDYSIVETMTVKEARAFGKSILDCAEKAEALANIKLSSGHVVSIASARKLRDELNKALEKYGDGK